MIEDGKQWFKFYPARWLGSGSVLRMTDAERGVYIQILAACWVYGEIPSDPWQAAKLLHTSYRTTAKWMKKYSYLLAAGQSGDSYQTVQKLFDLQEIKRKSTADQVGEEKRLYKTSVAEKRIDHSVAVASPLSSKGDETNVGLAGDLLAEFCRVMNREVADLSDQEVSSEMEAARDLVACYVGAESEVLKLPNVMKVMLTPGSYWRNACSTMTHFSKAIMKNSANGIMAQYQERKAEKKKKGGHSDKP